MSSSFPRTYFVFSYFSSFFLELFVFNLISLFMLVKSFVFQACYYVLSSVLLYGRRVQRIIVTPESAILLKRKSISSLLKRKKHF